MSDTSQGPGWWLASDGKWYPPEQWAGPSSAGPSSAGPSNASPSAPASPSTPPAYPGGGSVSGTGTPTYGYGQYAPQGVPYGHVARRKTNGMAIASLVCSCAGIFLIGIPAVLGIIFGFVARAQIRQSNGEQGGGGLALAGIIVGFAVVALIVIVLALAADNNQNAGVGVATVVTGQK
jgi:Domain of unknown function (DUF4190)